MIAYGNLINRITESGPVIMIADGRYGLSVMAVAILNDLLALIITSVFSGFSADEKGL